MSIGDAEYNPFGSAPRVHKYQPLQEFALQPGANDIELEVPWASAEMIAHPTNFARKITGCQFNVYHFIHIDTLGKIVEQTGSEVLAYYRDKWARAALYWSDHPAYQDERLMMERFDMRKHK